MTDRADWLKDRKNELDELRDLEFTMRDQHPEGSPLWLAHDREIERLQMEKDALTAGDGVAELNRQDGVKVTVSAEFAKRWTTNPQDYKDYFHADTVEIKE